MAALPLRRSLRPARNIPRSLNAINPPDGEMQMGFTFQDNKSAGVFAVRGQPPSDAVTIYNDLVHKLMREDASLTTRGNAAIRMQQVHPAIYAAYVAASHKMK